MAKEPTTRSRITNGSKLLPGVDGRNTWARRCRDVLSALISDAGGDDHVTEATRSILRRAAVLATELERREAAFARDGHITPEDLDLYGKTSAVLARLLEKTGIKDRVARDVTPRLADYIATKTPAAPLPPVPFMPAQPVIPEGSTP